jgi:uncharacterized repeat protein (TIGR01451 family)
MPTQSIPAPAPPATGRRWLGRAVIVAVVVAAVGVCAPIAAAEAPTIAAAFAPADVSPGQTSTLTFTLANGGAAAITNVAFSDDFQTLGSALTPSNPSTTCPTATVGIGASGGGGGGGLQLSFHATTLGAGAQCLITVPVFATQSGNFSTTSNPLTADGITAGPTATAAITVATAPQISAAFMPQAIDVGTAARLSITIVDGNESVNLTGVNFTGTLSSGLSIASPAEPQSPCGQLSAATGSTSFSFSGGTLKPFNECTVSFAVSGAGAGQQSATISKPGSTEGGLGTAPPTATVNVVGPPSVLFGIPSSGAVYEVGQSLSAQYSCADDPTLMAPTCAGTLPNGAPLDTSTPGTFSFSVTATSLDGQTSEQTISYSVLRAVPPPPPSGCPAAPRGGSRTAIGPARLGMTWAQAKTAFRGSSVRRRRRSESFCLRPAGIEIGYAPSGHAVWISTRASVDPVRGIASGASLTSAERKLPHGVSLTHSGQRWYVVPGGPASAVFGARDGTVDVVGIADGRLTRGRASDRSLVITFAR